MQVQVKNVKRRRNARGDERYYWIKPGFAPRRLPDDPTARAIEALNLNRRAEAGDGTLRRSEPAADPTEDPARLAYWIVKWKDGDHYAALADATKHTYRREERPIMERLGAVPVVGITKRVVKRYLDTLPRSRRPHALSFFKNVLETALDYDEIKQNPADRIRTKGMRRRRVIWEQDDIDLFLQKGPKVLGRTWPAMRLVFLLCLYTGQRISDVLAMTWADFDGEFITVVQQKTGVKVAIYCHSVLRAELDAEKPRTRGLTIVQMRNGQPYRYPGVYHNMRQALVKIGLGHLRLHDLRRTASTRLFEAGNDIAAVAKITGHSPQSLQTLIDVYIAQRRSVSKAGILRLEEWEKRRGG